MTRSQILTLFTFLILAPSVWAAQDRPNVVLIMTDDQGWGDFGVQGNSIIKTPHLDQMASRSASMNNFYVCPVCTPTRASLMTGRYNYRTRAIDTYIGRAMMDTEEMTVAEILSDAGYATGIFGKWHLGDCYPLRPQDQGFQESLIHAGGGLGQPAEPKANGRRYTDPILFHNGEQVATKGYCTDVYFDAAMDYMKECKEQDRPFFTYIATNAPHGPYHDVPEDLRKEYMQTDLRSIMVGADEKDDKKKVDTLGRICAMITNIDDNIGRLFAQLDKLNLTENTIVIFLVDNGPNSQRFVGPYRGRKTGVHEGGVRSPLWVQWPAQLKPGTQSKQISAHIDILPTILDACDVEPPPELDLDGKSLLPLLKGQSADWADRTIATQWHRGDKPVRYHHFMIRDSRWKLLNNSNAFDKTLVKKPRFELYDLLADPGESKNLAQGHPDQVTRLKTAYNAWFDDVSSTRPDNYAPPRPILGTPHELSTRLTRQDWRSDDTGWHAGTDGHWLIHFRQAGVYDVEVILDDAKTGGTVELQIGSVAVRQSAPADDDSCVFRNVRIPAGDATATAHQLYDGKSRGAYQVILTQALETK